MKYVPPNPAIEDIKSALRILEIASKAAAQVIHLNMTPRMLPPGTITEIPKP